MLAANTVISFYVLTNKNWDSSFLQLDTKPNIGHIDGWEHIQVNLYGRGVESHYTGTKFMGKHINNESAKATIKNQTVIVVTMAIRFKQAAVCRYYRFTIRPFN